MIPTEAWVAIGAIAVALNSALGLATLLYARRTEKNTNSMKDALVARTAEASEAKGRDDERARGEAVAVGVAKATAVVAQESHAAVVEGAIAAIEPVAEAAVAKGAKEAVQARSKFRP